MWRTIKKCFHISSESYRMRINRIRTLKLCYNCLRKGHLKNECKKDINYCNQCKTNVALCLDPSPHSISNNFFNLNSFVFPTIILLINFIFLFTSVKSEELSFKCPINFIDDKWIPISTTFCVSNGFNIYKNKLTKNICYKHILCQNQHIRTPDYPFCG